MSTTEYPASTTEPSKGVYRMIGLLSGSLVVFAVFALYCWIASDGVFDSPRIWGITAAVMALPAAFVAFAGIKTARVIKEERPRMREIRYTRFLKSAAYVALPLAVVVGVIASFSLVSLGAVDLISRFILFMIGFLIAALLAIAIITVTFFAALWFSVMLAKTKTR